MAVENITGQTANIEEQLTRIADALERIATVLETETEMQLIGTLPAKRNTKTIINVIAEQIKKQ